MRTGVVDPAGQFIGEVRLIGARRQPAHRRLLPAGSPGDIPSYVERDDQQPGQQRTALGPYRAPRPPGLKKR
jgi:hypothetical protein